jgi:hypothetical protein
MKHLKMLAIAAVAAMAFMVFATSSASATALYNGATKLGVGSTLDFSTKSGVKAKLTNTAGDQVLDECDSTVHATITNAGGAGVDVTGDITSLTWTNCTVPTATDVLGKLSVSWINFTEGTVRADAEISVTINTIFFGICRYGVANGAHIGTIKSYASSTAEFIANAVAEKQAGSEFACPTTTRWTATYVSTTPDNARVEAS